MSYYTTGSCRLSRESVRNIMHNFAKGFAQFVEGCKSYYVAHVGVALTLIAALAQHTGALTAILHGNAALAATIAGYCELAGLLTAYAPKAIEHAQDLTSGK
jgi:hypothetical protein